MSIARTIPRQLAEGLVNDLPSSYLEGEIKPISMTSEGRVRVAAVQADIEKIWTADPMAAWDSTDNPYDGEAW